MSRRLTATLAALIMIVAACGDNASLDELVADLESEAAQAPSDDSQSDTAPDDPSDEDTTAPADDGEPEETSDPAESTGLSADEQAVIDSLSDGLPVPDAEARCLVDGMAAAGIDPNDVVNDTVTPEDDTLMTDLILSCFEHPEILAGFVQNFAAGFALTAGFDLTTEEAGCLVAVLGERDLTTADLDGDDLPPDLQADMDACVGLDTGVFEPGNTYGDNPVLDLLWDECTAGIMASCDKLYSVSEIGSGYESFGATCGEREGEAAGGTCDTPYDYGDSSELDTYWDACEAGDGAACDELYFESPIGSVYEEFGDTCGNRYEESPGFCEDALG